MSEKKTMDHKEILSLLPHRYPFLFIDRVVDFSEEPPAIEAVKCFTLNEAFFQGHFPGEPVVPGVILIEALAQLGIIFFKSLKPEFKERLFFLAGVEKARFRRPVFPGDVAHLKLEGYQFRRNIIRTRGKVLVEEEIAAEAEIIAAIK
ncbi:MAG: 3-hydroxyacyl-ACP dehydratase FabZ [Thermodesulfobacteria bacterium]|nr:3-hydroxyacyl-ACP dehydratase FabZ [Thermodesulfobacteriota bacterium]